MVTMWSPVSGCGADSLAPSARTKHSATLVGGFVYLIGGRNGNLPLKDMWKYDIVEGRWYQLTPSGDKPPCLQEHTAVAYKDGLYVFGGEVGFSSAAETPLWFYDIKRNTWRKIKTQKGVKVPHGRRGHSALIYRGSMLIYGGYQDLKGSSNELWSFDFETESWHLLSSKKSTNKNSNNDSIPPARHKHSAVLHDDSMWIYGGMTDLAERNDLWKWCIVSKTWYQIKTKHNPGPLHSHAVCKLPGSMLIFGGESGGQPTNDLWKFNFAVETWEKIQIDGLKPQPRAESKAFAVSEFILKHGHVPKEASESCDANKVTLRARARTCTSADRTVNRHSSYLPQNRVTPSCEKTYVFQPTTNNYIDGSDESFHKSLVSNSNTTYKSAQPGSFLREIQKLSQLNLSKLSHNKCSYSVLNSANTESQESLLRQHASGAADENMSVTPVRNLMVKSQSEHFANKKRLSCQMSPTDERQLTNLCKNSQRSCKQTDPTPTDDQVKNLNRKFSLPREPISVPNFSTLILPTPVLTPVEAAKLVYLDSEEEEDDLQDPCLNLANSSNKDSTCYETFKPAMRDDSYSSHLCASIYQNIPKSASVKFQCPELEEVSDETGSTSDYASIEKVNNRTNEHKTEEHQKKGILKTPASDGPFGFANPHYMGPDIQDFLVNGNNRHSWNVSDNRAQQYAKLLNTPDSGVGGDMSSTSKSTSRHMFLMEDLELQQIDTRINSDGKTHLENTSMVKPPTSLSLNHAAKGHNERKKENNKGSQKRTYDKMRASSASRIERCREKAPERPKDVIDVTVRDKTAVQLYVFIVGGKEQGQITVFKRPISIWRLKLY